MVFSKIAAGKSPYTVLNSESTQEKLLQSLEDITKNLDIK
jgi:hypothetical protein